MAVAWDSFTVATEVGVMTNGTLVPDTRNVLTFILAKRTVAVDANVASVSHVWLRDGIVDGGKTVSWMDMPSALDTVGTKIPIRAVETLVTYAEDCLVTSITNRGMTNITTWGAEKLCGRCHQGFSSRRHECVAWMVTVLVILVAGHAQVVILTVLTGDEVVLGELCSKS